MDEPPLHAGEGLTSLIFITITTAPVVEVSNRKRNQNEVPGNSQYVSVEYLCWMQS